MPLVESESIVLKSYDLADADRIVVFFTREHGVVRGVAKGIKRLNSRFGSAFEPFNTVNLSYFQKEERELVTIQQAEIESSNFGVASDPDVLRGFSYIAELLLAFVPPNDPNEVMYRMLRACLASGARHETLPGLIVYFEMWLLKLGGYLPDWNRCHICRRQFEPGEPAGIDGGQHLICRSCHNGKLAPAPDAAIEIFRKAQKLAPSDFVAWLPSQGAALETSAVLRRIIERILDRPLTSLGSAAIQLPN
jgi:DNA repair protein RecO (recombination protein O)